jgi:hypothetical protein
MVSICCIDIVIILTMTPESKILVCSSFVFMFSSLYAMYYRNMFFSLLNALLTISEVMYWMNPVEGWWKTINNAIVGYSIFIYFFEGSFQVCVIHTHNALKTVSVILSTAILYLYVKAFIVYSLHRSDWWVYELWFQIVAMIGQVYVVRLVETDKYS